MYLHELIREIVAYNSCLETGCVQFFRDPLTDCKKKHGHGKDDHEDDDDDEDEDDGGPIREVIWSA